MTEQEWLACSDPRIMLAYIGSALAASHRKLWLFVAAVERLWWGDEAGHNDERSLGIVEAVAEGKLPPGRAQDATFSYFFPGGAFDTALECVRIHDSKGDPARWADLLHEIFGNPFRPVTPLRETRWSSGPGEPLHSYPWHAPWLTPAAAALARSAYDDRDWSLLPLLADALEAAGCADAALLAHLRGSEPEPGSWHRCRCCGHVYRHTGKYSSCDTRGCGEGQEYDEVTKWRPLRGPHVRGCAALDLVLGKE